MTVFGLPGYYLWDLDQYNTKELIAEITKPILILQGEDDFQVYVEKDFARWNDLLGEQDYVTLISYEGLNHFFIRYEGIGKRTVSEYEHPGFVEPAVINDIATWLFEQNEK